MFGIVDVSVKGRGAEFGEKAATLLEGIRDNGSLNKTAHMLPMAYSNAWLTMNAIEDSFELCFTDRDGARGSALTREGEDFLNRYRAFQSDVQEAAEKSFEKHFGDWER